MPEGRALAGRGWRRRTSLLVTALVATFAACAGPRRSSEGSSIWDGAAERAALWEEHAARLRVERAAEFEARVLELGELRMPFAYSVHGVAPPSGHALFVSLHGGGSAPKEVNDQQWENQKHLYTPAEGVYVAPRAPTDAWNMWHQAHMDAFLDRLIEDFVLFEGVDPDRVYLTGYSAGGDGVYQLAPRMADRFAAAAMMAGHPGDARAENLRNLPFALWVGANDDAYERNTRAREWGERLDALQAADLAGYEHFVQLRAGKGHWMDREDAATIPWMVRHRRDPCPDRVVWIQDDVVEPRSYWLAVDDPTPGAALTVSRDGNTFQVEHAEGVTFLRIRMDARMVDFDEDVVVLAGERTLFRGRLQPTRALLARTLAERGDPRGMWSAEVRVEL